MSEPSEWAMEKARKVFKQLWVTDHGCDDVSEQRQTQDVFAIARALDEVVTNAKTIKEMQAENEALREPSLQAEVDRLRVALVRIEHECIIRQPATAVRTVKDVRAIAREALAAKWKALNVASPIGEK